jgi:YfiH family protein
MMFDMSDLPQPSEPFEWVQAAVAPALVCRPLGRLARHVFTTRQWGLAASDPDTWAPIASALDLDPSRLVRVRQVHGSSVLVLRPETAPCALVAADIIVAGAEASGFGLAIQAADCVPLLIADRRRRGVAAVHAGWRELAAGAPLRAVAAMARELGAEPPDLLAALGPSIGPCCYEVGVDVRERFTATFSSSRTAAWFHEAPVRSRCNPPMPGLAGARRAERWFFDVWSAAHDQLVEAGLPAGQIFSAGLCTASHPTVFSSYRRDGAAAGRIAGAIRLS